MILPPLKIVQKFKEANWKETRGKEISIRNKPSKVGIVSKNELKETKFSLKGIQKRFLNGYQGYSKAKVGFAGKERMESLKIQQKQVYLREHSVTPEFLNSLGSISGDFNYEFSNIRQKYAKNTNSTHVPYVFKHKLPENLLQNHGNNQTRKVILSKTPDPWKKHINKEKQPESSSSESENAYIIGNY